MTISYQRDVASSTAGGFTRLLFKWKGSLYKLIYRELLLFMLSYSLLSVTYRRLMGPTQKRLFESVVKYFDAFINLIPLSFVLGFYVSYVASRWWQQFLAIPWPDKLFHSVACYVEGYDEDARMLRRSLMRWMNLALILVLRSISSAVKQRFPTLDHVVEAGFMTVTEKELFSSVPANEFNTYWVPCTWFVFRLQEATRKGKLINEYALENIMREFCEFRAKCGLLWCYDWVYIPMVYTQVVTLATYLFFVFTIIGRQKIDMSGMNSNRMPSNRIPMEIDLYVPVYTILQFFFYMGLLKVAEQLINPFGDDDEDFELNWLIDRHVKASFLGCDILMNPERIPPLVKDYYWDKQDCPIPYTEASMHFKKKTYRGSADDMKVPEDKCHMVLPEIEEEPPEDEDLTLSLTSLILGSSSIAANIGLGDLRKLPNSNSQASLTASCNGSEKGSTPTLPIKQRKFDSGWKLHAPPSSRGSSYDSVTPGEDIESAESERRDSFPLKGSPRRGSRLSDILQMKLQDGHRKKALRDRSKYRDKQGFVWRRVEPETMGFELPVPRIPHPRLEVNPIESSSEVLDNDDCSDDTVKKSNDCSVTSDKSPVPHSLMKNSRHPNHSEEGQDLSSYNIEDEDTNYEGSDDPDNDSVMSDKSRSPDTCSLRSTTRSENSFRTASSDPQLNLVPRQVSDVYKVTKSPLKNGPTSVENS